MPHSSMTGRPPRSDPATQPMHRRRETTPSAGSHATPLPRTGTTCSPNTPHGELIGRIYDTRPLPAYNFPADGSRRLLRRSESGMRLTVGVHRMTIVLVTHVFEDFPCTVTTEGVLAVPGLRQHVGIGEGVVKVQQVLVVLVQVDALVDLEFVAVGDALFTQALTLLRAHGIHYQRVAFPVTH